MSIGGVASRGLSRVASRFHERDLIEAIGSWHRTCANAILESSLKHARVFKWGERNTLQGLYHASTTRYPSTSSALEDAVLRAQELASLGSPELGLDIVYDAVDELMSTGQFAQISSSISRLDAGDIDVDILIGVLTATLPAKSRLPTRDRLVSLVGNRLRELNENVAEVLSGLV